MVDLPRCRRATWSEVDRWADRLAEQVRSAVRIPETLVGLTRGGWVPARLLSDRLGVKRVVSIRAQHWGVTATPDGVASLSEGLSGPVAGERVLIVDDITDTGESLALAVDHVRAARAASVETATFLHIPHSKLVPTYFAEEIPRDAWVWIVFPWNYWEDLVVLAQKAAEVTPGLSAIQTTLRERCHLEVPVEDLERIARYTRLGPA
ncbi:MAG: phosphoribosyltransferase [Thermoplasmata archaeon]|jgi:hypoxanthine phosphoribosyltransferase|nr:phosphoribosyltransferase [Thermoplasmata archaeon]